MNFTVNTYLSFITIILSINTILSQNTESDQEKCTNILQIVSNSIQSNDVSKFNFDL